LLMDRDEMSNLYREPSIDASYQVSVHLAEGFQRRRLKCEKLTDDGRQVMASWAKKQWYKWFVTWIHAISHLGRWLLHSSPRVIKLKPRFKVCNFSYLGVSFHSYLRNIWNCWTGYTI
jgi:hypothetical protein